MKILLLSRYSRLGASSRIRFCQYLPFLEANGLSVTVSPLFEDSYLRSLYSEGKKRPQEVAKAFSRRISSLASVRSYDLVWLEKELFPFLPAWGEMLLESLGVPVVVDYDDAIFHGYDRHGNPAVRFLLGQKIDRVMRSASLVVAGNDYLAERALSAGAKRVEQLPSVVDPERYRTAVPSDRDTFTIGWIGSPTTAAYLRSVEPALSEILAEGGASLRVVGAGKACPETLPAEIVPWTEETEVDEIHSFDVGIMPLPDTPWERGKCGFKLIQCMACGIPVVASPVGANRRIVGHGEDGFLASTTGEWTTALRRLRDDRAMRIAMGKKARAKVEAEYSLQSAAPRLLALLGSVAEGRG